MANPLQAGSVLIVGNPRREARLKQANQTLDFQHKLRQASTSDSSEVTPGFASIVAAFLPPVLLVVVFRDLQAIVHCCGSTYSTRDNS